jgi:hypothetical protein
LATPPAQLTRVVVGQVAMVARTVRLPSAAPNVTVTDV